MPILVQETQRALFYAPFYAAFAQNAFRDAGVEVLLKPAGAPADAVRSVLSGEVDVAWGGPLRSMLNYEHDRASELVCFCEVVTRDPFFLVGARPRVNFRLSDLRDLRIGAVREVPTPWLCLQDDLRRAGMEPADLAVSFDRDMQENAAALRDGWLDVIQTAEPLVDELVAANRGRVWYCAAVRGHTSYTCLYTRRSFLAEKRDSLLAMTRAMFNTQLWLRRSRPKDIAALIAPYFEAVPNARLVSAIARYRHADIWGSDPRLPRSGYERLQAALLSGGLVRAKLPFESAVDNSLAEEAMSRHAVCRSQ